MNVKIEISLQHAPQVVAALALALAVAVVLAVAVAVVPALLVAETLDRLAQEAFRVFLFLFPFNHSSGI